MALGPDAARVVLTRLSGPVKGRCRCADVWTMRQWFVVRGNRLARLACAWCFVLAVGQASVLVLSTGLAWAGEDPKQEAKARYSTGQSHYNLNEFQEALREFKEAYRLYPDPAFLFNAAQCERQLGHQEEAIQFYRSYLRNAPKAPNRQEVEHRIEELQAALESKKAATPAAAVEPSPVVPAPSPATAPVTPSVPVPAPSSSAAPASASAPVATSVPATASAPAPAASAADPAPNLPSAPPTTSSPASVGLAAPPVAGPAEAQADLVNAPASPARADEPAFYERWWFWTGVAVLAAGIGVGVYALSSGGGSSAPSSQLGTKNVF